MLYIHILLHTKVYIKLAKRCTDDFNLYKNVLYNGSDDAND